MLQFYFALSRTMDFFLSTNLTLTKMSSKIYENLPCKNSAYWFLAYHTLQMVLLSKNENKVSILIFGTWTFYNGQILIETETYYFTSVSPYKRTIEKKVPACQLYSQAASRYETAWMTTHVTSRTLYPFDLHTNNA